MEWIINPEAGNGDICPKSACYTNITCGCKATHSTGHCDVKVCADFTGTCNTVICLGYGGN